MIPLPEMKYEIERRMGVSRLKDNISNQARAAPMQANDMRLVGLERNNNLLEQRNAQF